MDGKRVMSLQGKLKNLIGSLDKLHKGSIMDVVDFIIKTLYMTHPDDWPIIKL